MKKKRLVPGIRLITVTVSRLRAVSRKDHYRDVLLPRAIDQDIAEGLPKTIGRRSFIEQEAYIFLGETVSIRTSQQIEKMPRIIWRPPQIRDALASVLTDPYDQGKAALPAHLNRRLRVAALRLQPSLWDGSVITAIEQ